jgi:hypothetical protein
LTKEQDCDMPACEDGSKHATCTSFLCDSNDRVLEGECQFFSGCTKDKCCTKYDWEYVGDCMPASCPASCLRTRSRKCVDGTGEKVSDLLCVLNTNLPDLPTEFDCCTHKNNVLAVLTHFGSCETDYSIFTVIFSCAKHRQFRRCIEISTDSIVPFADETCKNAVELVGKVSASCLPNACSSKTGFGTRGVGTGISFPLLHVCNTIPRYQDDMKSDLAIRYGEHAASLEQFKKCK